MKERRRGCLGEAEVHKADHHGGHMVGKCIRLWRSVCQGPGVGDGLGGMGRAGLSDYGQVGEAEGMALKV